MRWRALCIYALAAAALQAKPLKKDRTVHLKADAWLSNALAKKKKTALPQNVDEKGNIIAMRPALFSVYLGNRFTLPDTSTADASDFANANILRTGQNIYQSTGVTLGDANSTLAPQPALRLEWELPFERLGLRKDGNTFSALFSIEGGFTGSTTLLSSSGPFRYLNNQANAVELKDVTYAGSLTVSEKRQNITPMLGVGIELATEKMRRMHNLRFIGRFAAGVSLQYGQRTYDLSLQPQYINAVSNPTYSGTYSISSKITQSYAMAILPACRLEAGFRMQLGSRLHAAVTGTLSVLYGTLPYAAYGTFGENEGVKTTYQTVVNGVINYDALQIIPAVFLALSFEI